MYLAAFSQRHFW